MRWRWISIFRCTFDIVVLCTPANQRRQSLEGELLVELCTYLSDIWLKVTCREGKTGNLPSGDGAGLEVLGECIEQTAGALLREARDEDLGSVGVSERWIWDGFAR